MATTAWLPGDELARKLGDAWGWILLRGLAGILFGVLAFAWPGLTLVVLVVLWGAWALVDGVVALVTAWRARDQGKPLWPLVVVGVLGIGAGLVTLFAPALAGAALLAFIAAWAIVTGVFQVVHAIRVRKAIDHEWMLILSGILSVLVGVYLLLYPGSGALALVWVLAAWSIVAGVMLVVAALKFRKLRAVVPA